MSSHEAYRQYCEEISKRQLSNNEAFDKAILSLSSAGLALTLTFFKFVVPLAVAVSINIIERAWFLFLAAIISTIVSYGTSQISLSVELKNAEKYYLEDLDEFANKKNIFSTITESINMLAGVFFIVAIIHVVWFVTKNIKGV